MTAREGRRTGGVTLDDVARAAGVSPTTASCVLGRSARRVTPELDARVRAAPRELDYQANLLARVTALGHSEAIVLVTGLPAGLSHHRLAFAFAENAADTGLLLAIAGARDADDVALALRQLRGQRPRAIVLVNVDHLLSEPAIAAELIAMANCGVMSTVVHGASEHACGPLTDWADFVHFDGTHDTALDIARELTERMVGH